MTVLFLIPYVLYQIFAVYMLKRFMRSWHPRSIASSNPGITILTPMKDLSEYFDENILCRLRQVYRGQVELILGVADESDPALARSRELVAQNPSPVSVKWAIGKPIQGLNPKNINLAQAYLQASHSWIYCSDVDTHFEPDHIELLMRESQGNSMNFVTALKVHVHPRTFAAATESVGLNVELVTYFLMSYLGKTKSALNGAAFFFHRDLLSMAGGFEITLNSLTDDLVLEKAFRRVGGRGHLLKDIVYVGHTQQTWYGFLMRQLRWMLIAKSFKPWIMWVSPLYWVPAWFFIFGLFSGRVECLWMSLGLCLLRTWVAYAFQKSLEVNSHDWKYSFCIVAWDVAAPLIWLLAIFTREMVWAGQLIEIRNGGQIVPKESK